MFNRFLCRSNQYFDTHYAYSRYCNVGLYLVLGSSFLLFVSNTILYCIQFVFRVSGVVLSCTLKLDVEDIQRFLCLVVFALLSVFVFVNIWSYIKFISSPVLLTVDVGMMYFTFLGGMEIHMTTSSLCC